MGTLIGYIPSSKPLNSTVQRLLLHKKNSLPKNGLLSFGIVASSNKMSTNTASKDSTLRVVYIDGVDGGALVFRCEPNDPNYRQGCWAEKIFFDHVRNQAGWVKAINVESDMLHWFANNEARLNPKSYNIRLFVIYCGERPDNENIIKLGNYICQNINATPNNNTTISVIPEQFFWLPEIPKPVWSDIIGSDAALKALVAKKGMPASGYYEQHKAVIHTYFHPQSFTLDLARALYAPLEQVHAKYRSQLEAVALQDDGEDELNIEEDIDMEEEADYCF